jgi:hypothetical protein
MSIADKWVYEELYTEKLEAFFDLTTGNGNSPDTESRENAISEIKGDIIRLREKLDRS